MTLDNFKSFYAESLPLNFLFFTKKFKEIMEMLTEFFCMTNSDKVHETMLALVEFSKKHEQYLATVMREKKRKIAV